ncbi:MAG: ATP-grasp domain-containing protein [Caldilineaceae bacterium]|nr:ATP-grasp domain-containing protein [Caldilineaceae bacterium]
MTTILAMSSYFKGGRFLEECKRLGCTTLLLVKESLRDEAWPRHAVDEFLMMPSLFQRQDVIHGVSYLARERQIDQVIALDDFDVEMAAELRDHMRLPGLGASQARYFRDKLAMRTQAQAHGIAVPAFVPVLNYDRLRTFMAQVPAPWVLKPRSEASAMGIKKLHHADELWPLLEELGDRQSFFLLEQFLPGDVYHVDSVIDGGQVRFAATSKYGLPPMTVYQGGGVFATSTLPHGGPEATALQKINRALVAAMGLDVGVTHAEFIRSHADGRYYFLEVASRVGGAGIDLLVEHATGINPWAEWARVEVARLRGGAYQLPPIHQEYAGLIVSLARQQHPDTSAFNDPEIVWRLAKEHHVGLIVRSPSHERVQQLIDEYAARIATDFSATAPPMERATE